MTERRMNIRRVDKLMRDLVCENGESLPKVVKDFREIYTDTEEWLLFLTAESDSETKKCFPMTPSDVSRTRKRVQVETIVEEDEAMPLQVTPPLEALEPVRRGSRTAFKIAALKMKEPSLNCKLRRPASTIQEENSVNANATEVPPPKRARKDKSNMPKANASIVTPESSFVSARDSLMSDQRSNAKIDPAETEDDDIVMKKVCSTKISTYENDTKKSSLNVKTVTVMRSSKRVTKQLIKTVVESPAKCMTTRILTTGQNTDSPGTDSDDDIPLINYAANASKPLETEPLATIVQTEKSKSVSKNGKKDTIIGGRVPVLCLERVSIKSQSAENVSGVTESQEDVVDSNVKVEKTATDVAKKNYRDKTAELRPINCENIKSETEIQLPEKANAEDTSIVNTHIVQEPDVKKGKSLRPKALGNATNRNTPEAIRNLANRQFEPVSVKKRVEAIEQECFVEPVATAKPDVPVRMTRTKVRAMMASLSAVSSLPDKKPARKIEPSQLQKIARKSLLKASKISLAKERSKLVAGKSVEKENTPPPPGAWSYLKENNQPTNKNGTTPIPSQLVAQMSTSNKLDISPPNTSKNYLSQSTAGKKNRTTPHSSVHPTRLLAQMSVSKQPLVNLNTNISTFLPKAKIVSAAEKAEEKRKEERRQRRENNDDALLKKKALIDDKTEQRRKKREEKERNVLAQKALKEREMAEMKLRIEKEQEEKARLVEEREEHLKREILRKKEEAKLKAAKIEERRVRQEAERLQALKLQEEEQQKLLVQKKKEQEDAERLHAKRLLEEKERKEKEAALKEAAVKLEKLEKQNQMKKVVPSQTLDSTFNVEKPVLVAASKYDYPLLDLSKGNDSDFSEGEEDHIPSWAKREALVKNLKATSGIPIKALLSYFGSKPSTPDLSKIFPSGRKMYVRSSSAFWKSPPRCSMVPDMI